MCPPHAAWRSLEEDLMLLCWIRVNTLLVGYHGGTKG